MGEKLTEVDSRNNPEKRPPIVPAVFFVARALLTSNRFAQCCRGIRDGDGGPRGGPAGEAALGGSRVLPTRRLGSTGDVPKDTFFPTHR